MADANYLLTRARGVLERLGASDAEAKSLADEIGQALASGQLPGTASTMHTSVRTSEMDASGGFSAEAVTGRTTGPGDADARSGPA